jgi:hypothetical protein
MRERIYLESREWRNGPKRRLSRNSAQRTCFARLRPAMFPAQLQPRFAACALKARAKVWGRVDRLESVDQFSLIPARTISLSALRPAGHFGHLEKK